MCGIIGYLGKKQAAGIVLEGLKRLEYRGYDSAGVCVVTPNGKLELVREVGKLGRLENRLKRQPIQGTVAIGHSRWATHGAPSEENAHPHMDCKGEVVLVHNGIIENYMELKEELKALGHKFRSQTDTEVLAHLFEEEVRRLGHRTPTEKDVISATRRVLGQLRGAYAIVALIKPWNNCLIGMRKDCPLVVGMGSGGPEGYLASDIPALLPFTKKVLFMNEGDIAVVGTNGAGPKIYSSKGEEVKRESVEITWNALMAEKDGHKHFMHKEIHEGPRSFEDTLRGRAYDGNIDALLKEAGLTRKEVRDLKGVRISACGTAHYAGMIGEYLFENFAKLPTYAEIASEYRYKSRVVEPKTLMIAVSQSGETADTLAAMRQARASSKGKGLRTLGIVNQIGSTLTRETEGCIYTRCGPEIGVASTKAFFAQLAVLYLLALAFGRVRGTLSAVEFKNLTTELLEAPAKMRTTMSEAEGTIQDLAKEFQNSKNFLYLGRHVLYPLALEGALKLKEISYIHAEGYAAGEMKHGPIALIDKNMPVFAFAPKSCSVYEKTRSNLEEAKARGGKIIAVITKGDDSLKKIAHRTIEIPGFRHEWFEPVIAAAVLQLFAYHVANFKKFDVDQPRNLAKSVTVE